MKEFTDQPNKAIGLCIVHAKRELDYLEEEFNEVGKVVDGVPYETKY